MKQVYYLLKVQVRCWHCGFTVLSFLLLFPFSGVHAQNWNIDDLITLKGAPDSLNWFDACKDTHGNMVYAGNVPVRKGDTDIYISKVNPQGLVQWQDTFSRAGMDFGLYVATDKESSIYVAGVTGTKFDLDIIVLKYDSLGHRKWSKIWVGDSSLTDLPNAIEIKHNGEVLVCGTTFTNLYNANSISLRFTSSGELIFEKQYRFFEKDCHYSTVSSNF